jgi:hypothetical protein
MTEKPASLRCARSWEIEAMRDGRLRGQDAESLRRHLHACAACQVERASLESLALALASLPPPRLDALAGRRLRQRVLMAHNTWMFRQDRVTPAWRRHGAWLFAALLGVLLSAGAWSFLRTRRDTDMARRVARAPRVSVVASVGAHWSRRAELHAVRVVLDDGEFRLTIQRENPSDRVLIVLPDGEIEDHGTVLTAQVSRGATDTVRVEEGGVVLRLRNEAPLPLSAGQAWRRATVEPMPTPTAPASTALALTRRRAAQLPAHRAEATSPAASGDVPDTLPNTPAPSAPAPSAARAEDDAYLHLVELLREGRLEQARAAAKDYLLRFPNGFRRVEVLNIATRAPPISESR